jgi:hypothetical protein
MIFNKIFLNKDGRNDEPNIKKALSRGGLFLIYTEK